MRKKLIWIFASWSAILSKFFTFQCGSGSFGMKGAAEFFRMIYVSFCKKKKEREKQQIKNNHNETHTHTHTYARALCNQIESNRIELNRLKLKCLKFILCCNTTLHAAGWSVCVCTLRRSWFRDSDTWMRVRVRVRMRACVRPNASCSPYKWNKKNVQVNQFI